MHWKLKCLAFHMFSLPGGTRLHRLMQRRVTGNFLLTITDELLASCQFHLNNYRGGTAMEIGAGSNLLMPLLLHSAGARTIFAYDLERLATVEQVNHVIMQLRERLPGAWPLVGDLADDLAGRYGIVYRAPRDARHTELADGSVGFIYSTSVLEHVGRSEIEALLRECLRVGSRDCVMSHNIGYIDHYAHSDRRISYFNFYRYPEWRWWLYSPSKQHQNRLRHSDFEALFRQLGLRTVIHDRVMSTDAERTPGVRLAAKFRRYSDMDLYAHDGLFLLER